MAVTDLFVGEIATELVKQLVQISLRSCLCKTSVDQLIAMINDLLPTIQEIKYTGVELPSHRQIMLDAFSQTLIRGKELADKILKTARWNLYRNLQLSRKMEKLEKTISRFLNGPLQAHVLADVHHVRFDSAERFDRMDHRFDRIEQRLASMKIGEGGWIQDAMKRAEVGNEMEIEGNLGNFGVAFELGKRKVKEMLLVGMGEERVVGITGIGGSGKTTLATELCGDGEVRSYFKNRILFLTVSQSPNIEELRSKIWGFLSAYEGMSATSLPQWNFQFAGQTVLRTLVVLDDVWTDSALERLTFRVPGCTTLFVSRFKLKFPSVTYEVELLRDDEAMSLFCLSAFGQKSIPPAVSENLVKQIVNECKGLPLALKVIGASLRDQPEKYWEGARKRLSRGESICESHENGLLERMALSVECLSDEKIKQCFLDLGSFPEDKKIPLDIIINMWVEIHDLDEEEAFAILVDLADKNLLTLVKDEKLGAMYTSYYDYFVTQHDVLRDLALHLSNRGKINGRKRLLMPKRDLRLPNEWKRKSDQPFNAQIVSVHTGEMNEVDWFPMEFPKAEVLILNFSSNKYFLPTFISNMPRLRALIVINNGTSQATLHDFSVLSGLATLRSLWLEKVYVPQLSNTTALKNLHKISLILCKINNFFDQSTIDLTKIFPCLSDLTIDHCNDVVDLPSSICGLNSLNSLSITNCRSLSGLPANLGNLKSLQILRLYACPKLKALPERIGELFYLKYLDISQCVNVTSLPEEIGYLGRLEKLDMRECPVWHLPSSAALLKSLRHVVCDEEIAWIWKDVEKAIPGLHVQAAEKCFSIAWLDE